MKISNLLLFLKQRNASITIDKFYDFKLIGRYFYNRPQIAYQQVISDNVANDIDIDEMFEKIDYTSSCIGQQYLYAKLRTIDNKARLLEFDELVSYFETDNTLSCKIKKRLLKLSSHNGYYFEELFQGVHLKLHGLRLPYLLSFLFLIFVLLAFFNSFFLLILIPIYSANLLLHYSNKRNIDYYIWGASELSKTIKAAKHLIKEPIIREHFKYTSFLNDLIKTEHKSALITFERRYDDGLTSALFYLIELVKISLNLEVILFHHYLDDVKTKGDSLNELFCFIGEIDSAISVAELRFRNNTLCKPIFTNSKQFEVKNILHPLVDNCIANSLTLVDKSLLLTGSNMSGKTTFIRAVAINALLAQTINCCFASYYKAPFFKILSSIRIADNIQNKTSYFLEEVLVIKEFINHINDDDHYLFVLDEIFKGTNTLERIAAGKSILAFLNSGKHIVLVSTHDIELTDLLEKNDYECYHFSEKISNNKLCFDYQLHDGRLKTKNAIKILELYGFPSSIIADAKQTQLSLI